MKAIIVLLLGALVSQTANAWDEDGHRIVALIAGHYLLPETRDKINALLATDTDPLTSHDLASEATWADRYIDSDRTSTHVRYDAAHEWQFANIEATRPNIPAACYGQPPLPAGTPASRGPAQACIIDKINQFAVELSDAHTSRDERLLALKYLLNLVGDIHEPLRVADESNDHGRKILVSARNVTPGNLFEFWDRVLVGRLGEKPGDVAATLIARISQIDAEQWSGSAPQLWALEAHQIGIDRAYGMLTAFDDNGRYLLQDAEIEKSVQSVALQLSRAGVRLAHILNDSLAPTGVAQTAPNAARRGDKGAGLQFAAVACSVCHVVAAGETIPENATTAPDFQAVANTRGMSEVALREFLFGPHPTMPNIRLTQKQANDVIAYILDLQKTR